MISSVTVSLELDPLYSVLVWPVRNLTKHLQWLYQLAKSERINITSFLKYRNSYFIYFKTQILYVTTELLDRCEINTCAFWRLDLTIKYVHKYEYI